MSRGENGLGAQRPGTLSAITRSIIAFASLRYMNYFADWI